MIGRRLLCLSLAAVPLSVRAQSNDARFASFLAGGEIPVPVVQGTTGNSAVSILYKEFGIRLNFTPTIAGDVIRLHVKPEVSALDYANGVTLTGFRIPALTTRRAETEIELRDGQSFAIAGLMHNVSQGDRQQIPGLGSLPIIGYLFKSKAIRQSKTELMVLITPRLVKPLDPDEGLRGDIEDILDVIANVTGEPWTDRPHHRRVP